MFRPPLSPQPPTHNGVPDHPSAHPWAGWVWAIIIGCVLLSAAPLKAHAEEVDIQADQIHFDEATGRYIAEGNVLILRDGRQLLADRIEYDQQKGMIYATGSVQFVGNFGDILYADRLEVDDNLQRERAHNFRVKTGKKERIAARSVIRDDKNTRHFENFVYSPCHPCQQNPDLPPTWQLKSEKATHDLDNRDYVLRHAIIEVAGWPVAYTPYFRYPDGSVKRRSGILIPDVGTSSHAGGFAAVPYFIDLGWDKNLVITPTFTTKAGGIIAFQYDQALDNGSLSLEASGGQFALSTKSRTQAVGHIDGAAHFFTAEGLSYGGNYRRASNTAYLSSVPTLDRKFDSLYSSRMYVQSLPSDQPRNLYRAEIINYQDSREITALNRAATTVPLLRARVYLPNDSLGGRLMLSAQAQRVQQSGFATSNNLGLGGQYRLQHVYANGIVASYQASLDLNHYRYDVDEGSSHAGTLQDGSKFIAFPRVSADLRLPFYRDFLEAGTSVISPIVMLSTTPGSFDFSDIPNHNSVSLSDGHHLLLARQNLVGNNRQDDSTKLVVAIEWDHFFRSGNSQTSLLLGRAFKSNKGTTDNGSRYANRHQDYIIRLQGHLGSNSHYSLTSTFDPHRSRTNSNTVHLSLDESVLGFASELRYTYLRADPSRGLQPLHQGSLLLKKSFGEFWSASGYAEYDFQTSNRLRKGNLTLDYSDESLTLGIYVQRRHLKTEYLSPENTLGFNFRLKFGTDD